MIPRQAESHRAVANSQVRPRNPGQGLLASAWPPETPSLERLQAEYAKLPLRDLPGAARNVVTVACIETYLQERAHSGAGQR